MLSTLPYRWLGLMVLLLAGSACFGGPSTAYRPPPAAEHDSTLGEGDVFEVAVYGEKELSGKYRVGQGGVINFPLIGAVTVAGKDQAAVAVDIQEALRTQGFLKNPHVSVLVTEMESKRVTVLGAVDSPGSFKVTKGMTVLRAVSLAGGFTPLAEKDGAIVTRRTGGRSQRFKVPVGRISEGREQPVEVMAGDTIYIPERIF